jgi:NAD+ diphosphatase
MRSPNYYAHPGFERAGLRRRESDWIRARALDPGSLFVPVWRTHNLVVEIDGGEPRAAVLGAEAIGTVLGAFSEPDIEERFGHGEFVFLGVIDERAHFALDLSAHEAPLDALRSPALAAAGIGEDGLRFADLRQLAGRLARHEGALLALARAMVFWHSRHRFCGVCGAPTRSEEAGHMRRCTDAGCKAMHFPRTDPAVIMLVTDGERALLGRNKNFIPGMYSTLAGFVEPGESLEDARWFERGWLLSHVDDDSFRMPRRDSIARRLIEDWLAGHTG